MNVATGDSPIAEELGRVIPLPGQVIASDAFEETFRDLFPRAMRLARGILGDDGLAEDAAAEAFARAHASWRKVGSSDYRDAWILRVTANVAIDIGRKRKRSFPVGLNPRHARGADVAPELDPLRAELPRALATLPRRQREIFILRYLNEFPESDVAASLGVSIGTVKKEAFRARQALRTLLGDAFEGGDS